MGQVHARQAQAMRPNEGLAEDDGDDDAFLLSSVRAKVMAVNVEGLGRTKDDIVMDSVKDLFKVEDFENLVLTAQGVRGKLQDLGCFSDVGIHIDTMGSGDKDYQVTFKVEELKKVQGSVNTMITSNRNWVKVGNNEGSLMTGVKLPNLLGRGERLQADYTYGTKKSSNFNLSLLKPLRGKLRSSLTGNVYQSNAEHPSSGFKQLDRGFLADFAFTSAPHVQHSLQYEAVWRNISCLTRAAAFAVRENSGHSLKSSLRHILCVDRRDSTVFPTKGSYFKLSQEFAGLGGNVGFFKNELELQANLPVTSDISLQASLHGGMIRALQGDKTFNISDHFFLGGPLNLRGFELRGAGPSADGSALGGSMYWASGLHLYTPLPFRPGRDGYGDLFKTHVFVTAGNVGNFGLTGDLQRDLDQVTQDFRLSYGLGLALKLGGVARIELNYCVPVKASRGDRPAPGLQFGVGVNFL